VCSELLRFIPAALNLFRKALRSRVSNEKEVIQLNLTHHLEIPFFPNSLLTLQNISDPLSDFY
jgi:hypothetical protein